MLMCQFSTDYRWPHCLWTPGHDIVVRTMFVLSYMNEDLYVELNQTVWMWMCPRFLIIKSGMRTAGDWKTQAFCLETKERMFWDMTKFEKMRFSIFCDKTRPKTSGKIKLTEESKTKTYQLENWSGVLVP